MPPRATRKHLVPPPYEHAPSFARPPPLHARGARRSPIRCRRAAEHALPAVSRNAADSWSEASICGKNFRTGQPVVGDTAGGTCSGDRHPAPRSRPLGAAAGRDHEAQNLKKICASMSGFSSKRITSPPRISDAGKHPIAVGDEQFTTNVFREVGKCCSGADCKGLNKVTDRRCGPWTRFCAWAWAKPAQATDVRER